MKYLDEYRDPQVAQRLVAEIRCMASQPWVVMDVCGGQTHGLLRHGIEAELEGSVELIHGPGCPVCVTPVAAIDLAQRLATRPDLIVTSFGDMLRVPGSRASLLDVRACGGNVNPVYSPGDAVELARRRPDREVVFFAVGFETTAPATALAVLQADAWGLDNFSMIVAHVCVLPAMQTLMLAEDHRVQGFLAAGHVCTVTGTAEYEPFATRFGVPIAITGFEPLDLLRGIHEVVRQLESGESRVVNCYPRSVRREGNESARRLIEEVYEVTDRPWRGFGPLPGGGLRLRDRFRRFDAEARFASNGWDDVTSRADTTGRQDVIGESKRHKFGEEIAGLPLLDAGDCCSGAVLAGRIKPPECPAFASRCHPDSPLGAPMVSSEGACAAYYRHRAGTSA